MASEAGVVSLIEKFNLSEKVDEQKRIIENVADILTKSRTTKILNVVESLGVYLTSQDVSERRKGTLFLAELAHRISPELLNDQEIDVLTLFFCDRLKDHHSIQPQVTYGLLAMVSYYQLTDALVVKMCQTIFAEVHVQSLSQADRRNMFNLLSNLLDKNVKALQRLGPDFVLGFIQCMDGEKDPRNLLVCFRNTTKIIAKLSFEVFAEDLFEVTSCYFPIDFTPPSHDKFHVTREQLVNGLRDCLSSTPVFAEFLLPLLMEKLSSNIVDAKIDSLLTLGESVLKYTPTDVKDFTEDIWNAIRRDFLLGGIKALESSCEIAIASIIKCLEPEPNICKEFINLILRDCEHSLKDPDLAMAEQIGIIIQAVAFATSDSFEITMPRILGTIVNLLHQQQSNLETNTVSLLKIVNHLLQKFLISKDHFTLELESSIKENFSSFLLSTISSTDNTNLKAICLNCLLAMLQLKYLADNEIKILTDFIINHASMEAKPVFHEGCCKGIALICSENLVPECGYVLDKLEQHIEQILENSSNVTNTERQSRLRNICQALAVSFSNVKDLVAIVNFLIHQLDKHHHKDPISVDILQGIERIVIKNQAASLELEKFILPAFLKNISNNTEAPSEAEYHMAAILLILVSNLPISEQQNKAKLAAKYFAKHATEEDSMDVESAEIENKIYADTLIVYALLCGLHADVAMLELDELLNWLQVNIESCKEKRIAECACKIIASFVNKIDEGEKLDSILRKTLEHMQHVLTSDDVEKRERDNLGVLFLWICKAVVLRWQKSTPNIINQLLALCHNENIGKSLCENFSIIVEDFPDCLNAKMHAKVKLMYKQRFVEFVLPKLVEEYKRANENAKGRFLKAMAHLMQQLPKQVLQKKISPLMPLLIRSLSFSDLDILSSTLATITALDAPKVIKDHVTSLVPRLLSLTGFPSLDVRVRAIRCLASLCKLPPHVIYPYQKNVVRTLKTCLDDKKRFVRKEAIKCRSRWYLLKEDM
eukprot:gene8085-8950_t